MSIYPVKRGNPHHDKDGRFTSAEMDYEHTPDTYSLYANASMNALTNEQQQAIHYYGEDGAGSINHSLRHDQMLSGKDVEAMERLDSAMKPLPWDAIVYRSASGLDKLIDNGIIEDKGFVSTSARQQTARAFGGIFKTRIFLPKGTPAIAFNFNGEQEILLPRNSRFRVLKATPPAKGEVKVEMDMEYVLK